MFFSIIVPTCNRVSALRECLSRLEFARNAVAPVLCEIIVTDDGTTGEARRMIESEFPWVRSIKGPQKGPAANRNHGRSLATGEWFVFIDDDCLPDRDLLNAYLNAIQNNPACMVFEGRISPDSQQQHPLELCPINEHGGNLWSCNFAIRSDLFIQMNGFDDRFPDASCEDFEFRVRLQKAQHTIRFNKAAFVTHPWRKLTVEQFKHKTLRDIASWRLFISKHPEYAEPPSKIINDAWRFLRFDISHLVRRFGLDGLRTIPLFVWRLRERWHMCCASQQHTTNA